MLILATITLPAMRGLTEGRRVREAARAINVYFSRARSRAIESGRPCGVMLERLERQPDACVILRQAEVPPPYSGDVMGAVVWPQAQPIPGVVGLRLRFPLELADGLVRRDDSIQLNNQGPWYTIIDYQEPGPDLDFPRDPVTKFIQFSAGTDGDSDGWIDSHYLTIRLDSVGVAAIPWPSGDPVPFQILRQPVASAGAPFQLSRGAVIDLNASGLDRQPPFQLVDPSAPDNPPVNPLPLPVPLPPGDARSWPVIVMFSANGSVDSVYHYELLYDPSGSGNVIGGRYTARRAVEPIQLMVGKWERIPQQPGMGPPADDGLANWQDATNLWLALNPQTGLVTVAELNANLPPGHPLNPFPNTYIPGDIDGLDNSLRRQLYESRKFARQAQISKGGR